MRPISPFIESGTDKVTIPKTTPNKPKLPRNDPPWFSQTFRRWHKNKKERADISPFKFLCNKYRIDFAYANEFVCRFLFRMIFLFIASSFKPGFSHPSCNYYQLPNAFTICIQIQWRTTNNHFNWSYPVFWNLTRRAPPYTHHHIKSSLFLCSKNAYHFNYTICTTVNPNKFRIIINLWTRLFEIEDDTMHSQFLFNPLLMR